MPTIDTVVIGAGHAGLAVSRLLTQAGRDHVVLDRGRLAESWRSERWDSLNLLSPNWMTRLPGWLYGGADQEGYMSAGGFVRYLEKYADSFAAPVETGTTVHELVSGPGSGYRVVTDRGTWQARYVVVATGPWGQPHVPTSMERLDPGIELVSSSYYRNPARLQAGGVLVVGASASGVQIADELARAGRDVVIAVGRHTRMPRSTGGSSGPAGWPAPSTRWPTRSPRDGNRRCSWSATTSVAPRTSTCAPCRTSVSGWSAG